METVLQAEQLTKRFGTLVAVDHLSLEIQPGEVFGLLGPNGAGKTTTIRMLCGLLPPDEGRVLLDGRPLDPKSKARVGVCPQELVIWEKLTCLEQLEFLGAAYGIRKQTARQRGDALLEQMGLSEKRNQLAGSLSGGMKRRLNLILALIHDPELLVLDEPEAGLDPQSRILVREFIRSLAKQKTILLTTHNMDEAERLATRLAIVDRGKLLLVDTPENLKNQAGSGDILELEVFGDADALKRAVARLENASFQDHVLSIRTPKALERIPTILDVLQEEAIRPGEIRLRQNCLEDVFISLTGRRLRE